MLELTNEQKILVSLIHAGVVEDESILAYTFDKLKPYSGMMMGNLPIGLARLKKEMPQLFKNTTNKA